MKSLSRRHFLVGNGALLSLPFLPSLANANKIAGPAKKFVLMYLPNGLARRCFIPGEEESASPGCKNGTPISNAWLTIAQQLGVEMNRFSNSTGTISGLFS